MADVENQQEVSLPVKRKPDLYCQDQDDVANKVQKLQPSNSAASESKDGENCVNIDSAEEKVEIETEPVIPPAKAADSAAERDEIGGDLGAREGHEESDGEDEQEESRREAEANRKGKGIMRDDKGKGKLIEEDESDDEDDDDDDDDDDEEDDDDDDEDVDSDLSDDPLAEVDLDNILPSRTRRRSMQPGLFISDEIANQDDDDDDSEDSDA